MIGNENGTRKYPIPFIGLFFILVGFLLLLIYPYEFSLSDEDITEGFVVEDAEADLPENQLALNVSGQYNYEDTVVRLSEMELDSFLEGFDEIDVIETVEPAELDRISVTLAEGTDPEAFASTIEGTDSINIRDLNSLIVEFREDGNQDAFVSEFESIRVIEAMLSANEQRLIVALNERTNPDVFAQRFSTVDGVSDVEIVPLSQLVITLPQEANLDEFVENLRANDAVEVVRVEPLSRLIVTTTSERANPIRITGYVQDQLQEYFPRADLNINLWLLSVGSANDTLIKVTPEDTGIPLFWFVWGFVILEIFLVYYFANRTGRREIEKLIHPLIRAAGVFLFFWSLFGHEPLWDLLLGRIFSESAQLTSVYTGSRVSIFVSQHLELVIVSSIIIIPTGLLLGILVTRAEFREFLPLANIVVNSAQTVPTLAIVAIMVPIMGTGFWPAIVALVLYGLLPVVRNTIVGLEGVDPFIIESARGMGMTPRQILMRIELPIASRVIIAGIRTSMVVNIGTATLGAYVGSGGLGQPIASGLSLVIDPFVLLGALPAAGLAVLMDYILGQVEYVITPSGLQIEA